MRKIIVALFLVALMASPAFAGFTNGGFEDGNFNGWTKNGGYFYGSGSYNYVGDPGKSAIVTPGPDFYTNNNLNMVLNGGYAARVNNYDDNYHFSTISQTVTNWQDTTMWFAWAAVLEEPGNYHPPADAPNFSVILTDMTTSTQLINRTYNVYSAIPGGWLNGYYDGYDQWKYVPWQAESLDTSGVVGHNLQLTILGSDCGLGWPWRLCLY